MNGCNFRRKERKRAFFQITVVLTCVHASVWEKNAAVKLPVSLYILLFEGKTSYFQWKCINDVYRHQLLDSRSSCSCRMKVNNILYLWYRYTLWPVINEVLEITKISPAPVPLCKIKHQVDHAGRIFIIYVGFVQLEEILVFMVQGDFNWL